MKFKNLFLCCCVISLILLSFSCTNTPGNFAISPDGVKIRFDKQGTGEPALIFVHGWCNNKNIWDAQISHFSKKYQAIALDLAGFGESGNSRKKWTMASFGDDVAAVIKKLHLKNVVLIGFSMGAPVIIETAKKVPERVSGLVLVDDLQNIETKYSPDMISNWESFMLDVVTAPTIEKMTPVFVRRNLETAFKKVLPMVKDVPQTGWRESLHEYFRWVNDDCLESIKMISAPVVSINSDSEPTNVEAFRKYIPSYKANIIPDVGHVVFWDAPDEFNRLLEESIQEFMKQSKSG